MKEDDIRQVMQFLHEAITLTQQAKMDHEAAVKAKAAAANEPPAKATTKVHILSVQDWKPGISGYQLSPNEHEISISLYIYSK